MPTSQACQHQHQANFSSLKTRTKKPHCNIAAAMLQSGALERNAVLIKNPQTVLWGSGGAGAQRTISAGVVRSCSHTTTPHPHHTIPTGEGREGGGPTNVPSYIFSYTHTGPLTPQCEYHLCVSQNGQSHPIQLE